MRVEQEIHAPLVKGVQIAELILSLYKPPTHSDRITELVITKRVALAEKLNNRHAFGHHKLIALADDFWDRVMQPL